MLVQTLMMSFLLVACLHEVDAGKEVGMEGFCIQPFHKVDIDDGELFSPFWPLGTPYLSRPYDTDCHYTIVAPFRCVTDLFLEYMDMAADHTAKSDCGAEDDFHVASYDGYRDLSYLCGFHERDNRWRQRGYFIHVGIDVNRAAYSRYHLTWHVHKEGEDNCNERHTGDGGILKSPGYPGIYYNAMMPQRGFDLVCNQVIEVDKGDIVELIFLFVDLEDTYEGLDQDCMYKTDAIMVVDHDALIYDYSIAVICGHEIPPPLYSERGPALTVSLISDLNQGAYGYVATWKHFYVPKAIEVVKFGDHGDVIRVETILVNEVGNKVPHLSKIMDAEYSNWFFAAKATNLDACDVTFSIIGEYNDTDGTITFEFKHLPPGHYQIEYMASSYNLGYDLHNTYEFTSYNKDLMAMRDDYSMRATSLDFMIYEMYDSYTRLEREKLQKDLAGGFQLFTRDIYIAYVNLERDYYTGYIKASVWVRAPSLLTKLRALCNVISSAYPFKFCYMDDIRPIRHSRTLTVFDQEFGHETCNPCATAVFQHKFKKGCHCPCHCAGTLDVKYSAEIAGVMDITQTLY